MRIMGTLIIFWALTAIMATPLEAQQPPNPDAAQTTPMKKNSVTIASGDVDGIYFPTAGAICVALKTTFAELGVQNFHCSVEPSTGSVDNITHLTDQDLELGIVQSDTIRKAWEGEAPFLAPKKQLRSVISLYTESLTLITLAKSGIKRLEDLKGKRINLGGAGSSAEHAGRELLNACGFQPNDALIQSLNQNEAAHALKKQEIDAYLHIIGHPNENIWEFASTEKIAFIPLSEGCLNTLSERNRLYVKTIIPGGTYPGIDMDTPTLGVKATLVTTADTSEEIIYTVTKAIVDKLYRFKRIHPDFDLPDPKSLFDGLIAPLHLGAFRYYQELRVLEFQNTGHDIMSELPDLIDKNNFRIPLKLTKDAPDNLKSHKILIGSRTDQEAGIPLIVSIAPTFSRGSPVYWLLHPTL